MLWVGHRPKGTGWVMVKCPERRLDKKAGTTPRRVQEVVLRNANFRQRSRKRH